VIPSWLAERIRGVGDAPAIIWRDRTYSYSWLWSRVSAIGEELDDAGVPRGAVVALESDYSPDACAFLLALIDRGAVVVPLTAASAGRRDRFLEIAGVERTIRLPASGESEHGEHAAGRAHPLVERLRAAGASGLVLFTSGSTGDPKAALHSFPLLLRKFESRRHALRTMTFLLLDHIGGINTLFHIVSNGGTVVVPEGRSPDAVCATIAHHAVELLPTTPTFLNLLLLSEALVRHDVSSVKQITYGTEPMPESTLQALHHALPGVRLSQTYGLSELGILRARSKSSDSLWVRLDGEGVELRVQDGTLRIRSASAMLGYLNAPSPFDAEGWFNTEDEVETDGEFFRLRGRRSEIINVGGEKVYPTEVESVLLQIENVRDAVVRGEPNPLTGQIVAASLNLHRPEPLDSVRRRVRQACRALMPAYQVPARIEIVEDAQYGARFKRNRRAAPEPV
jgi:acyl-CoA synthetase (AMP-forming)/AMP-acid ligase II